MVWWYWPSFNQNNWLLKWNRLIITVARYKIEYIYVMTNTYESIVISKFDEPQVYALCMHVRSCFICIMVIKLISWSSLEELVYSSNTGELSRPPCYIACLSSAESWNGEGCSLLFNDSTANSFIVTYHHLV